MTTCSIAINKSSGETKRAQQVQWLVCEVVRCRRGLNWIGDALKCASLYLDLDSSSPIRADCNTSTVFSSLKANEVYRRKCGVTANIAQIIYIRNND
jgi:hypothetical protein